MAFLTGGEVTPMSAIVYLGVCICVTFSTIKII